MNIAILMITDIALWFCGYGFARSYDKRRLHNLANTVILKEAKYGTFDVSGFSGMCATFLLLTSENKKIKDTIKAAIDIKADRKNESNGEATDEKSNNNQS